MIAYTPTPILISLGPLAIRYYSLAYLIGFLTAWYLLRKSAFREHADDLLLWIVIGVIAGGRLGEFLFYSPNTFWMNPLEVLQIWHGGMSFHGGLIGCILAVWLYTRKHALSFFEVADVIIVPTLIGLFLGRIANFLNGELYGTVTTVPWCVTLPGVTGCRHPSPLYEAFYTLVILLVIAGMLAWRARDPAKRSWVPGTVFGVFLVLYGVFRAIENIWRDDVRWWLGLSTGQWLSVLTALVGIVFLVGINRHRKAHKPRSPKKKV